MLDPIRAARLTPSAFARYATRGWFKLPRHLRHLERLLVEVAAGRKKRVLVSIPPRHGKSELCSVFFVAWFLGIFPDKRVILASYEGDFAAQFGRRVRDLLTEHGPTVFGIRVRQDSSAANRWDIVGRRGGMQTAGAGGAIMGKGADLFVIDDPHKEWADVFSEKVREGVWDWWQSVAKTRLEPGASVLVLQQRWHEKDLMGHLLEQQALDGWEHFNFPALAERGDILGRSPGEALWPERFDRDYLEKHRLGVHPRFWEAQYQQHPSPLEGGLFRREHARRYALRDGDYDFLSTGTTCTVHEMTRFVTVDTATSTKDSADHTAIAAWGVEPYGKLVLLDLDMRRIEGPEIMRAIVTMCEFWRCVAWVEENSTSKHLLSFMESEGIPFRTLAPGARDKLTRAQPAAGRWFHGQVAIPESTAGWPRDFLEAFERQLYRFTGEEGGEDDAVDAFAWAAIVCLDELSAGTGLPDPGPASVKPRAYLPAGYETRRPPGM